MPVPVIAIIGRANVGKSTLFNKLTQKRAAIVNDTPGVTRDRLYGRSDWLGHPVVVVDTGGIDMPGTEEIELRVKDQARIAQDEADVIIFVVDNQQGITPQDEEVVDQIRKSGKPFYVAVNKVDHPRHEPGVYEFSRLGVDKIYPISAEHGYGIPELMEEIVRGFPEGIVPQEEPGESVKVAVVGKPNAGKSSLINKILDSERCIVSPVPGTTRDATDSHLQFGESHFTFIDTAGIRRKGRTRKLLDKYSVIMALKALDRCDIAVLVLDGVEGVTEQDATIAGYAYERGKGCIVVVNKWDLLKQSGLPFHSIEKQVREKLRFLDFAPVLPVSAKTGQGVNRLLPLVEKVYREYSRSLPTAKLNESVEQAVKKNPLSSYRGKFLKLYYVTQIKSRPPTFRCFVNFPQGIHFSYKRYLINSLRKNFGFMGTPIRLLFSGKGKGG